MITNAQVTPVIWRPVKAQTLAIVLKRAIEGGATPLGDKLWIWRSSGGCTQPVQIHYTAGRGGPSGVLRQYVRCRRCDNCYRARRLHWTYRAGIEFALAPRTWLLTFTLKPEEHLLLQYKADLKYRRSTGNSLLGVPTPEQFPFLAGEGFLLITKFFKRLRKNTKAPLRYMVTAEAHKSGLPHYHALVHETDKAITKREFQENWQHGFSNAKLVLEPKACAYVAKYINKANAGRVRASLAYGKLPQGRLSA